MHSRRKLIILLVVVVVVIWFTSALSQRFLSQRQQPNNMIVTDTYTLTTPVDDDLVVLADTVSLQTESAVTGDAALVARKGIWVNGHINGDLTVMGDRLIVGQNGHIQGDLTFIGREVMLNGQINGNITAVGDTLWISSNTQMNGTLQACVSHINDSRVNGAKIQPCDDSNMPEFMQLGSIGQPGLGFSIPASLLFTGLAALGITLFPRWFSYIREAVYSRPRRMMGTGCLALIAVIGFGGVVMIGLALVPALGFILLLGGMFGLLVLLGMLVAGWITLALMIGEWLLRCLRLTAQPPLIAVILGSVSLLLAWHVLALLPLGGFLGLIGMVLLSAAGLGAVIITRLGTRPLQPSYFVQG